MEVYYECVSGGGSVRVEFKDGQTYDLNATMEKLSENTYATLRILCLTGCKITDHSKSKCI